MGELRERMEQDLRLKNLSPATRKNYLCYARKFAAHFRRPPEEMGEAEVREFLLHALQIEQVSYETYRQILAALKSIERAHGRPEVYERNAPRELDLDLLVFDDEIRATFEFTLPHPRAADRLFVLAPAREVAPQLVWPGLDATVDTLLARLASDESVERLGD